MKIYIVLIKLTIIMKIPISFLDLVGLPDTRSDRLRSQRRRFRLSIPRFRDLEVKADVSGVIYFT